MVGSGASEERSTAMVAAVGDMLRIAGSCVRRLVLNFRPCIIGAIDQDTYTTPTDADIET